MKGNLLKQFRTFIAITQQIKSLLTKSSDKMQIVFFVFFYIALPKKNHDVKTKTSII